MTRGDQNQGQAVKPSLLRGSKNSSLKLTVTSLIYEPVDKNGNLKMDHRKTMNTYFKVSQ